jgi:hypothetical protein
MSILMHYDTLRIPTGMFLFFFCFWNSKIVNYNTLENIRIVK